MGTEQNPSHSIFHIVEFLSTFCSYADMEGVIKLIINVIIYFEFSLVPQFLGIVSFQYTVDC